MSITHIIIQWAKSVAFACGIHANIEPVAGFQIHCALIILHGFFSAACEWGMKLSANLIRV